MNSYIESTLFCHIFNIVLLISLFVFSWIHIPFYLVVNKQKSKVHTKMRSRAELKSLHESNTKRIDRCLSILDKQVQRIFTEENGSQKSCQFY